MTIILLMKKLFIASVIAVALVSLMTGCANTDLSMHSYQSAPTSTAAQTPPPTSGDTTATQ
jgi:PBP1b-binding outer membrane lipoprotein LpoB